MLLAKGMPKAAVFPEPVRDWTIRSLPAAMSGRVSACTGIGPVNPISSSARRTSAWSPISANVMVGAGGSPGGPSIVSWRRREEGGGI